MNDKWRNTQPYLGRFWTERTGKGRNFWKVCYLLFFSPFLWKPKKSYVYLFHSHRQRYVFLLWPNAFTKVKLTRVPGFSLSGQIFLPVLAKKFDQRLNFLATPSSRRILKRVGNTVLCHLFSHCNENPIYVFPENKLRGLSPNFHIYVSVADRLSEYKIAHRNMNEGCRTVSFLGIFVSNFRYRIFAAQLLLVWR